MIHLIKDDQWCLDDGKMTFRCPFCGRDNVVDKGAERLVKRINRAGVLNLSYLCEHDGCDDTGKLRFEGWGK